MTSLRKKFSQKADQFRTFLSGRGGRFSVSQGNVKYYKNIFWMFTRSAFFIVCMVFVNSAVIRYLGREQYGALSYAMSIMFISLPLAGLGIEGVMHRELVLGRHPQCRVFGTGAVLRLLAAFLTSSCLLLFSFLYAHEPTTRALLIVVSAVPLVRTLDILEIFFQSRSESKAVVFLQGLAWFFSALMRIVLIVHHASLVWFGIVIILDAAAIVGPLIYSYFKSPGSDTVWHFDRTLAGTMLLESWPGLLCLSLWQLSGRIDQVFVKNTLGNHEFGLYAAAIVLVENFSFIPYIFGGSLFPQLVLAREEKEKYCHNLGRLFEFVLIASLALILVYSFAASWIVHFLFGIPFKGAAVILSVYVLRTPFLFMADIRGRWLVIENLQLKEFCYRAVAFVLNIVLCLFWLPLWGAQGAAWAAVISLAVGLYCIPLFDPRLRDVNKALHQAARFPLLRDTVQHWFSGRSFLRKT